jgi:hypothetical protein
MDHMVIVIALHRAFITTTGLNSGFGMGTQRTQPTERSTVAVY